MDSFIWKDRLCKIVDGMLFMSRVGAHDDWDFCPRQTDKGQAVALKPTGGEQFAAPYDVHTIEPIDENRILINNLFVLEGEPMDGGVLRKAEKSEISA